MAPSSGLPLTVGTREPPQALGPSSYPRVAPRRPGWIFLTVKAQGQGARSHLQLGWGAGEPGSHAAEMEAPTLQGQADVTKAEQTPCHDGVTANSVQYAEPLAGQRWQPWGGAVEQAAPKVICTRSL